MKMIVRLLKVLEKAYYDTFWIMIWRYFENFNQGLYILIKGEIKNVGKLLL